MCRLSELRPRDCWGPPQRLGAPTHAGPAVIVDVADVRLPWRRLHLPGPCSKVTLPHPASMGQKSHLSPCLLTSAPLAVDPQGMDDIEFNDPELAEPSDDLPENNKISRPLVVLLVALVALAATAGVAFSAFGSDDDDSSRPSSTTRYMNAIERRNANIKTCSMEMAGVLDKAIAYGGNEPIFYEYGAQSGQGRFLVQVYGQFRANQMAWGNSSAVEQAVSDILNRPGFVGGSVAWFRDQRALTS